LERHCSCNGTATAIMLERLETAMLDRNFSYHYTFIYIRVSDGDSKVIATKGCCRYLCYSGLSAIRRMLVRQMEMKVWMQVEAV
jgi:hypothetical protein